MLSRFLLCGVLLSILLAGWKGPTVAAEPILPVGSSPAPIVSRYFPDRLHTFVWRNWNLVEPEKMAKLVGASRQDILAMADSMGLPPPAAIPKEQKTRGYITLISRNWHLLPYDQLLQLLDMTPERLAFILHEDDFLIVKLGMLKPKCRPLRYVPPDEAARHRSAEIKRVVEEELGADLRRPAEPRFHFLEQFNQPPATCPLTLGRAAAQPSPPAPHPEGEGRRGTANDQPRFIYSYCAVYGDTLFSPKLDPFPNGLLQRLSAMGINGVWLHVVLRNLAPGGATFPEFGAGHEQRLANLRHLVKRAKKYGVGVYLYLNEPRAMPEAFFRNHPDLAGVREGPFRALCTSQPAVRQWMSDSLAYVFSHVPDLAGVFTITASENLTNCASHYAWKSCPHCKNRSDAEIIAEVNATIAEGVHRGNPKAKVIAWDWGWRGHGETPDIIRRLPKSIWLMSVSEWGLPICRGGIPLKVGEYSISAVGPGPRATHQWKTARAAGLKTVAKVQLNSTWELSSVPYLPVMDLVAEHCRNLASTGVDGMMLSWTLGGYPSPNLEIAARFRARPTPSVEEVLNALAIEHYGAEGAPLARKAWTAFSTAFREYPYDGAVLYNCPVQLGPANPLYLEKTGYAATMTGIPYDDLRGWRGPYPSEVFATQFEKVARGWRSGLPLLQAAVAKAPPEQREDAMAELRFARVAAIHFQSVANQTRFVVARDALADPRHPLAADERHRLRQEIRALVQAELTLAREEFLLTQEDSRIGFEAANQYFFVPLDLAEKVINCRWLLDQFRP